MELPDCPPGTEGYNDVVVDEVPKKLDFGGDCTKAEQEFQEHLGSLKIKLEDGSTQCMVEKQGRDVSGKWIYLCYPCAAVCSGEAILQTHISGKKHKNKLAMRSVWPLTIFKEHPYINGEKGNSGKAEKSGGATEKVLKKMAQEVDLHKMEASDLDGQFHKYRSVRCHLQDSLDALKAPLLGLEYLVEHPPEEEHHEPAYICVLCSKQGHPRTIVNHLTCFWHRYNYLARHFPKATSQLGPYRGQNKYREGVSIIMTRMAQRIEDKYGRQQPVHIDKHEYEKDKEIIHQWIFRSHHFSEADGHTFEEVVDIDLINSLHKSNEETTAKTENIIKAKDPSPPVVAAPKAKFNNYTRPAGRQERGRRAGSPEEVSLSSDDLRNELRDLDSRKPSERDRMPDRSRNESGSRPRFQNYADRRRDREREKEGESLSFRTKYALKNAPADKDKEKRPPNYEYKVKLATDKRKAAEEAANKLLIYHEKNPEKHPLYPEEWKKFWNRRYKEIQAEGKDPSKHDFKPEWIEFWTARMKVLHEEELRGNIIEIYRKLCMTPPDMTRRSRSPPPIRSHNSQERGRKSPLMWSLGRRHSPPPDRRHSPPDRDRERDRDRDRRRASPGPRPRGQSPPLRSRGSPPRLRRPEPRRPEPDRRRERRSPEPRRSPPGARYPHRSPPPRGLHSRSRSPPRGLHSRSRSPLHRGRSPVRTQFTLESVRRSRSPLSRRDAQQQRNNSPTAHRPHHPHAQHAPSMQTVMISDDELKPDNNLSPWNSDNDIESLGSLPDARSPPRSNRSTSLASHASRGSRVLSRGPHGMGRRDYPPDYPPAPVERAEPQDLGPPENVVATLRLLVALEDYLGSVGPKVVDLMTTAIKMEKESANSSEELLERESALVLIETAKEKLKGAVQAGLVAPPAAPAVRAAVVRAAATLHAADTRAKKKQISGVKPTTATILASGAGVSDVGGVDRAKIAQQMAAALIAQGKTDVSSEELAQLVDAVVGMAEAKKRQTEVKKKVEARAMSEKQARPSPAPTVSASTASALQMLQSAYDENDKKAPEKDIPDAMDGLSDSDLETLLKNFNELSAEEQHSLIAYLKKLEAKEPRRVEKLRQYVSAAAASATKPAEPETIAVKDTEDKTMESDQPPAVTIESDDDDYTVEEVFKLATQKVKENQIRQEMEIVKKSLEAVPPSQMPAEPPTIDLTKHMSAATDLFAMVQASISNASMLSSITSAVTNLQPRSFGDGPPKNDRQYSGGDQYADNEYAPSSMNNPDGIMSNMNNAPPMQDQYNQDFELEPQNEQMYEENMDTDPYNNEDPSWNQRGPMNNEESSWDQERPMMNDDMGPRPGMGNNSPINNMGSNRPMDEPGYNNLGSEPYEDNIMNGKAQNNYGPRPGMHQGDFGGNQNFGPRGDFGGNQRMARLGDFRGNQGNIRPLDDLRGNPGNLRPLDDLRGNLRPLDDLRGNLRPLDETRGNLRPLDEIRGNLRPLDDLRGNLRPLDDLRGNLRPLDDLRGNVRPLDDLRGNLRPLDDIRGNLRPFDDVRGNLRSLDDLRGNLRPLDNLGRNQGDLRPQGSFGGNQGSHLGDFRARPLGDFGARSRGDFGLTLPDERDMNQGVLGGTKGNFTLGALGLPDSFGGNLRNSGPQGNFGNNQGDVGPQGKFGGNQGFLRPQGSFGGNQGNDRAQLNFGNQGNRGGPKGFGGNQQGNFRGRGGRGNFGGPKRGRGRGFY